MNGKIICSPCQFRRIDQDEFMEIDRAVMRVAFDIQNSCGRLFDEFPYRRELIKRLTGKFDYVETEVPITATFQDFEKPYALDLVINRSVIYELKSVASLKPVHVSQLLHYLFLTELAHGKLVNFGSSLVEYEFVSSTLTLNDRRRLSFHDSNFEPAEDRSRKLRETIEELLRYFGGFLDTRLYYEAIYHFFGGKEAIVQPISFVSNSDTIATQRAHLIAPWTAFKITSFKNDIDEYQIQLQKFLKHTDLQAIHWINLHGHDVTFETVKH